MWQSVHVPPTSANSVFAPTYLRNTVCVRKVRYLVFREVECCASGLGGQGVKVNLTSLLSLCTSLELSQREKIANTVTSGASVCATCKSQCTTQSTSILYIALHFPLEWSLVLSQYMLSKCSLRMESMAMLLQVGASLSFRRLLGVALVQRDAFSKLPFFALLCKLR